jgi:hypothetical protein
MSRVLFDGKVFAEYAQFFLISEEGELPSDLWTPEANAAHVVAFKGGVAVGTSTKHGYVSVRVEYMATTPSIDEAEHVVDAPLQVSGPLKLMSISSSLDVDGVPSGEYTARINATNIERGLEVGDGADSYKLQVFPSQGARAVKVIRTSTVWPR